MKDQHQSISYMYNIRIFWGEGSPCPCTRPLDATALQAQPPAHHVPVRIGGDVVSRQPVGRRIDGDGVGERGAAPGIRGHVTETVVAIVLTIV